MKIKQCETLTPEQWHDLAERLREAAPIFAGILETFNHEGTGKSDAMELMADMMCAAVAADYVGAFAAEKCHFLLTDN